MQNILLIKKAKHELRPIFSNQIRIIKSLKIVFKSLYYIMLFTAITSAIFTIAAAGDGKTNDGNIKMMIICGLLTLIAGLLCKLFIELHEWSILKIEYTINNYYITMLKRIKHLKYKNHNTHIKTPKRLTHAFN